MWESLATNRRQDRVLHGAAKLVNVVVGLVMFPVWLLGQRLAGPLSALLRGRAKPMPLPPAPLSAPQSLDSVLAELQRIPHRLRPSRSATLRKGLADLSMFILSQKRQTALFGYSYPRQFEYHYLEGADGERIAASVAVHEESRPGLIVVHGLVSSRLFDYVREIAVRAYYDWGFNVVVPDLRSFGLTEMLTYAPGTGGWKEGEDIICAARYLKSLGATSVGALGISLGSSSVMNASHPEGAELLDGGILAICGPGDVKTAVEYIDRSVPRSHPFYSISKMFDAMLVSKVRNLGWPSEVADFGTLIEHVVAPRYGITPDDVYERSSAKNHIQNTRVPLLILHAEDDEVIPVAHARELEQAAVGNDNVRVWIVPGGGHAAFDVIDKRWTYTVYRTFFERLARYEPAAPSPDGRGPTAATRSGYPSGST
jgi:predicted alpha/beta-fold hydrolase